MVDAETIDTRHWGEESSDDERDDRMPGYTPLPTDPTEKVARRGTGRMGPVSLWAEFDTALGQEGGDGDRVNVPEGERASLT